jgi:replicative DNA helicase
MKPKSGASSGIDAQLKPGLAGRLQATEGRSLSDEGGHDDVSVRRLPSAATSIPAGDDLVPHAIAAEQGVIGALLLNNDAWDNVSGKVSHDDFYTPEHQQIFRLITDLLARNIPADVITVTEEAKQRSIKISASYLGRLARETPGTSGAGYYAEIIRKKAMVRQLIASCQKALQQAVEPGGVSEQELLDGLQADLFRIAETGTRSNQGFQHIGGILTGVVETMQEAAGRDDDDALIGTSCGFTDIDRVTSGLRPSDLIIVAGRPAMGKTSFCLNIAEHIAVEEGLPVGVFSMEMSSPQIALRFLSQMARIDQSTLAKARLSDDQWARLSFAMGKYCEAPIYIDDGGSLNPMEIRSRARKLARACGGKLGLLVIDYIQLMTTHRQNSGGNRSQEITEISQSIKALAKELNCPIVALSQLSRKVEERTDKRPLLSDLRESGAIEQDADLVMFLYRDEYYKPDSPDKGIAEAIIAKHRNGPTANIQLAFHNEYTRFANLYRGDSSGH